MYSIWKYDAMQELYLVSISIKIYIPVLLLHRNVLLDIVDSIVKYFTILFYIINVCVIHVVLIAT